MLTSRIKFVSYLMITIWVIFAINLILPIKFGVHPRELTLTSGLGLFTSPFFHGSLGHIMANSLPLAMLAFIYSLRFNTVVHAAVVTLYLTILGNIGVWLFGAYGNHIGASGLIFAYFGYIVSGIFSKGTILSKLRDIVLAAVTMFLYGFIILNLFHIENGISWSAHAWGFIAGIILGSKHHLFNNDLPVPAPTNLIKNYRS